MLGFLFRHIAFSLDKKQDAHEKNVCATYGAFMLCQL